MDGDTVTKLGLSVYLRVAHKSLTSNAPGMGWGKNVGLLRDFVILTLLPPGASMFLKHMSRSFCNSRFPHSSGKQALANEIHHDNYTSSQFPVLD